YLIALGYVVNLYQRGTASLKRINEIQETVPTIGDEPSVEVQPSIKGAVEFRNLTFGYNGKPVLKDVDLKIEPGKTVAFVGKTGSGKSTLVSLIPRLMDAPENTIFVDGISVRRYPLEQLRKSIGFVPQETFLFSDTLAENIAFGVESRESRVERQKMEGGIQKSDVGRQDGANGSSFPTPDSRFEDDPRFDEIKRAAEIAGLANDIESFPYKYEQLVGERGITLSGGQKQRTAIARAVIRDPRILILDDSLSAVDTYTEETILHNLRDVRENRTTLIVSHRVSTIRDADLICVLEDGRIIERGTHQELVNLNGEYADLYRRQLLEEELAATE
ncbi:MAG TPA: ABC transporter ATP-binding protein, partial [Pyrinomonadaceae bacterium]